MGGIACRFAATIGIAFTWVRSDDALGVGNQWLSPSEISSTTEEQS